MSFVERFDQQIERGIEKGIDLAVDGAAVAAKLAIGGLGTPTDPVEIILRGVGVDIAQKPITKRIKKAARDFALAA